MSEGSEVKEMKREMITIQRQVSKFIEGYLKVGLDYRNSDGFLEKWSGLTDSIESKQCSIGGVLMERIAVEEKGVYRLYESFSKKKRLRKKPNKIV